MEEVFESLPQSSCGCCEYYYNGRCMYKNIGVDEWDSPCDSFE